jgi:two-component system sensor histidine kinase DesK
VDNDCRTNDWSADAEPPGWAAGWRRYVFPGVFLVYLGQTLGGVSKHSHGLAAVAGYLILAAFCAVYLASLATRWVAETPTRRFWMLYAIMVGLTAVETAFAHEDAFVMLVYVAVVTIGALGGWSILVIAAYTLIAMFVPPAIPSWHTTVGSSAGFSIPIVSLAMFGFFAVIKANRELLEARIEVARLASENERNRIARDLHDLLGHSLTTITIKAGLARRLSVRDPDRAATEIGEVEELARRSLADVRAAVSSYREVSLAGELATGRELLRAAGIDAHLPTATDVVAPEYQVLFGWVIREGLTNVVRHAGATRCTITFDRTSVEIVDDGIGSGGPAGNGLTGLRERVTAGGGVVEAGKLSPSGWRLRVDMPASGISPAGSVVESPAVRA